MAVKKFSEHKSLQDIKDINNDILDLFKEIKRVGKETRSETILYALRRIDLEIDYKSVAMKDADEEGIDSVYLLSSLIKDALIDAKEMCVKGTDYGVQLALSRIEAMIEDRKIIRSPFLVEAYRKFENDLWNITKLREIAYGQIARLKEKQDNITRTALEEEDSMMRVRYFEDIKVIEKDILRLENEAHQYDTLQVALHNEDVLKGLVQKWTTSKDQQIELKKFQEAVLKLEMKGNQ